MIFPKKKNEIDCCIGWNFKKLYQIEEQSMQNFLVWGTFKIEVVEHRSKQLLLQNITEIDEK